MRGDGSDREAARALVYCAHRYLSCVIQHEPSRSRKKRASGSLVAETQGAGRACVRNVEAAARHVAVRAERKSGGGRRVGADRAYNLTRYHTLRRSAY